MTKEPMTQLSIRYPDSLLERVSKIQDAMRLRDRSEAIRILLEMAVDAYEAGDNASVDEILKEATNRSRIPRNPQQSRDTSAGTGS